MMTSEGLAAALVQRGVTGRGQHVEVALYDAIFPTLASNIGGYFDSDGEIPERTGNRHDGLGVSPYRSQTAGCSSTTPAPSGTGGRSAARSASPAHRRPPVTCPRRSASTASRSSPAGWRWARRRSTPAAAGVIVTSGQPAARVPAGNGRSSLAYADTADI